MEKRKRLTGMVFLAALLALSVIIHAGSLEPSAPPRCKLPEPLE